MPIALNIGQKVRGFEAQWLEGKRITAPIKEALVDHPFGTGPHSVAFTDGTIDAMAISSTETRMDGHERGFNFCVDPRTVVKKSVVPGQRLPKQEWKWAVLNAGGGCTGDHCSVNINKGCPDTFDTEIRTVDSPGQPEEEVSINRLPGMEWGTHHTHPDRKQARPSVADKLLMIEDAIYQRGPAFSCITALPEVWKVPDSWWKSGDAEYTDEQKETEKRIRDTYGPDRPTRCLAIPDNKLPTLAETQVWRLKYNAVIRPYYKEWKRLGYAPGKEYIGDYDKFRRIYDSIDAETEVLMAQVSFSDTRGMKKLEDITIDQNMSPGYFGGYEVALQQLPPDTGQMPPPLPTPPEGKPQPRKSTFDEVFDTLANCEQRIGPYGEEFTVDQFDDIISLNDLEIRHPDGTGKSIQEVCKELSDLGDVWFYSQGEKE